MAALHIDLSRLDPKRAPSMLAAVHEQLGVGDTIDIGFAPACPDRTRNDIVVGAGFEMVSARGDCVGSVRLRSLPDHVGPNMKMLFCGLNPSVYAADAGVGYARPGNRFWPSVIAAGLVTRDRDWRSALFRHRIGLTDLVKRATSRADVLARREYVDGRARVERLAAWLKPEVVVFVGLTGYRQAVNAEAGPGSVADLGGAPAYLMPSTSGRNAHVTLEDLVEHVNAAIRSAN